MKIPELACDNNGIYQTNKAAPGADRIDSRAEEEMGYDLTSLKMEKEEKAKGRNDEVYFAEGKERIAAMEKTKKYQGFSPVQQISAMSFCLYGALTFPNGCHFRFSVHYWPLMLKLAILYGWESGTDFGQTVSDADAMALASSLEKSLPDIPDHDVPIEEPSMIDCSEGPGRIFDALNEAHAGERNPFTYFAGIKKQKIVNFIGFCKMGAFRIE